MLWHSTLMERGITLSDSLLHTVILFFFLALLMSLRVLFFETVSQVEVKMDTSDCITLTLITSTSRFRSLLSLNPDLVISLSFQHYNALVRILRICTFHTF